jgi:type IV fimbrial biogenesis protein FimT
MIIYGTLYKCNSHHCKTGNQTILGFAMIESPIYSCILNESNHANQLLLSSRSVLKEIEQPMCNNRKSTSGFTLLELMITISVAGILMAMAIPSFSDMIRNNRLTTYANELVTSLNIARSEAIKRGVSVSVRKIGGTGTYWSTSGWNVFVDNDADGTLDTGEEILRTYPALPSPYTLAGNNNFVNFIRYQPNGTSNQMGSFAVCANTTPLAYTSKLVIVSNTGRIRIGKDSNGDGIPENDAKAALTSCTAP